MADSPDPEIRFRIEEHEMETRRKDRDNEYEDANDTLDGPRDSIHAHGEGDAHRGYGNGGLGGPDGIGGFRGPGFDGGTLNDNGGFLQNRSHTVTIKPEPYDGGDDWEEYISHFELCAELGRWRATDKVLALAAALRGPARTFYISMEQSEKRNYAVLTQKLGARFGSTRQQNRWLSRLEMRKRQPGESVAALADDLRQMAQRAYIDLDGKAQEVLALNQLYKSVGPEVKYQCTNQGCRTVAEAVEVMERYEAIMGDGSERKKGSVRMTKESMVQEDHAHGTDETQMKDTLNGLTRRISQLEATKPSTNFRPNTYNQSRQGGNSFNTYRREAKCFICDSTSHICRNCPFYLRYRRENGKPEDRKNGPEYSNKTNSNTSNQGNFRSPLAH